LFQQPLCLLYSLLKEILIGRYSECLLAGQCEVLELKGEKRKKVPNNYIELVLYLFTTVLDGRNTPLADGVQQALGRAPRSFSDYVQQTAATGIWGGNNV
jgi:hypothetical protein